MLPFPVFGEGNFFKEVPVSKNREIKEAKVSEIHEKLETAKSAVLVDYRGLNVEEVTELRNQFRAAGVEYHVYKNRLVKLAIKDTPFEALDDILTGPNAIAIGYNEPTDPARVAKQFAKTNNHLELKGGILEGEFYDANTIVQIADIPSRDVLISKLLGSIQSPVSKFARLVSLVAEQREG